MIDQNLKKYFWDVDFEILDAGRHKTYILERILEMGDESAVLWIKKTFSKEDILTVLKKSRKISKKSLNFWNFVLNN